MALSGSTATTKTDQSKGLKAVKLKSGTYYFNPADNKYYMADGKTPAPASVVNEITKQKQDTESKRLSKQGAGVAGTIAGAAGGALIGNKIENAKDPASGYKENQAALQRQHAGVQQADAQKREQIANQNAYQEAGKQAGSDAANKFSQTVSQISGAAGSGAAALAGMNVQTADPQFHMTRSDQQRTEAETRKDQAAENEIGAESQLEQVERDNGAYRQALGHRIASGALSAAPDDKQSEVNTVTDGSQPAEQQATQEAAQPAEQQATQEAAQPAEQQATQEAAQPAEQQATQEAAQPAEQPAEDSGGGKYPFTIGQLQAWINYRSTGKTRFPKSKWEEANDPSNQQFAKDNYDAIEKWVNDQLAKKVAPDVTTLVEDVRLAQTGQRNYETGTSDEIQNRMKQNVSGALIETKDTGSDERIKNIIPAVYRRFL